MGDIKQIKKRFEKGYVMSIYGTSANLHNQMRSDIETLLKALSIHDVSHCEEIEEDEEIENCPNCGSEAVGFGGLNKECFDCEYEW